MLEWRMGSCISLLQELPCLHPPKSRSRGHSLLLTNLSYFDGQFRYWINGRRMLQMCNNRSLEKCRTKLDVILPLNMTLTISISIVIISFHGGIRNSPTISLSLTNMPFEV